MRETQAIIERVRRVSANLQQLDLSVEPALAQLKPGHSLFAHPLTATSEPSYLRAQWIPVDLQPGRVIVEMDITLPYTPGAVVKLLSPVGSPIPLRPKLHHLLLIADDALPTPLVLLTRNLTRGGVAVTLVLGGHATQYPLELLPPEVEVLHSDTDWTWPEQVETFNWADQVLVLAPVYKQPEVYRQVYDTITQLHAHNIPDHYVCGLYYPRLACGVGACLACMVPAARNREILTCSDGPAIDLKRMNFR